jgi:hypothetical protein
LQSRGKKDGEIQTEVGKMQSRGTQWKAETEWLARERERQVETTRGRQEANSGSQEAEAKWQSNKRQGKSAGDKQRQARGRQRHAHLQSRGKKGRDIQTKVGKMQSRGRQKKAEAEWLARGRKRQVKTSRDRQEAVEGRQTCSQEAKKAGRYKQR